MKCIFLRCLPSPSVDPQPPVTEVNETVHADEESAGASIISKLFVGYLAIFSQSDQCDSLVLASTKPPGRSWLRQIKPNLHLRHFRHVMDTLEELGIWLRCTPAFAATFLRVKQESRARTLLCAAGSMDAEHPGYVDCNISFI